MDDPFIHFIKSRPVLNCEGVALITLQSISNHFKETENPKYHPPN
jgi:hypothetical protein